MRRALLAASIVLLAACSSPCEELGDKICSCFGGSSQETCERQVQQRIDAESPNGDEESFCEAELDTCDDVRSGASFCDWLESPEGKEKCGLAYPTDEAGAP